MLPLMYACSFPERPAKTSNLLYLIIYIKEAQALTIRHSGLELPTNEYDEPTLCVSFIFVSSRALLLFRGSNSSGKMSRKEMTSAEVRCKITTLFCHDKE